MTPSATSSAKSSSSRQERDCASCLEMLNSTLMKATRASKLLSAMNANIFSNPETGEVSIRINDSDNLRKQAAAPKPTKKPSLDPLLSKPKAIPPSSSSSSSTTLVAATSARTDALLPLSEIPSSPLTTTYNQPPPVQIQCTWCGNDGAEGGARAYVKGPEPLSIVLCANRLSSKEEIQEVLVHELIHVYDVKFRGLDLRECTELAHSEIRAAREAECHDTSLLFKNLCIKTKATIATSNMFPKQGKHCVNQMFDVAMKDLQPMFWKNPNTGASSGSKLDSKKKLYFVPSDR